MTSVTVSTEAALNLAIYNSNIGAGGTTIVLANSITLSHSLIVNKNSDIIDGGSNHFGIDANGQPAWSFKAAGSRC